MEVDTKKPGLKGLLWQMDTYYLVDCLCFKTFLKSASVPTPGIMINQVCHKVKFIRGTLLGARKKIWLWRNPRIFKNPSVPPIPYSMAEPFSNYILALKYALRWPQDYFWRRHGHEISIFDVLLLENLNPETPLD